MFKSKLLLFSAATFLPLIWGSNVSANTTFNDSSPQKQIEQQFKGMSNDEKVLPMPLGGYLHGHAKVGNIVDGKLDESKMQEINSATDPNSISVKEAKELALSRYQTEQKNPSITPFRDDPAPTTSVIALTKGQNYTSDYFGNANLNHWTFSSYWFLGQTSAGHYGSLNWKTYNGPGRVGTTNQANNTYYGSVDGTLISSSSSWATIGNGQLLTYYTNATNAFFEVEGTGY